MRKGCGEGTADARLRDSGAARDELVEESFDVFLGEVGEADEFEGLLEGAGFEGDAAVEEEVGEAVEVGAIDHDGGDIVGEDQGAIEHNCRAGARSVFAAWVPDQGDGEIIGGGWRKLSDVVGEKWKQQASAIFLGTWRIKTAGKGPRASIPRAPKPHTLKFQKNSPRIFHFACYDPVSSQKENPP